MTISEDRERERNREKADKTVRIKSNSHNKFITIGT